MLQSKILLEGFKSLGPVFIIDRWLRPRVLIVQVFVNEEYIRNGCYIIISTDVDNYVSFGLNSTVTILTDTVLLAEFS